MTADNELDRLRRIEARCQVVLDVLAAGPDDGAAKLLRIALYGPHQAPQRGARAAEASGRPA